MLPKPMTDPDCDLRGLPFMPLDVVRLMDSDFFALSTGDEFKAGVSLWCKSWNQVPAGSLPDNDRVLAHLSTAGKDWPNVKEMAMRGWVLCSDGRWYHPVVSEKAVTAWGKRIAQRERAEKRWKNKGKAEIKEEKPSHGNATALENVCHGNATASENASRGICHGNARERERERESIIDIIPPISPKQDETHSDDEFDKFWQAYPRKQGKQTARRSFAKARKSAAIAEIMAGLNAHNAVWPKASDPRAQYIPHPSTWLNEGRWGDDPQHSAAVQDRGSTTRKPQSALSQQLERMQRQYGDGL